MLNSVELPIIVKRSSGLHVSIYLPTHRADPETHQDPIRLKNLLREAEIRLHALGLCATTAHELLKPARQLLEQEYFWRENKI
jgi:hypothetical protein